MKKSRKMSAPPFGQKYPGVDTAWAVPQKMLCGTAF